MTFSWDFNTATLIAIGIQVVALIVFLVRTHSKANAAQEAAEEAKVAAEKAHKRADEAHLAVGVATAGLSLFREQVAANYVDREALREMEQRLTDAINRLGDRLDQSMHGPR